MPANRTKGTGQKAPEGYYKKVGVVAPIPEEIKANIKPSLEETWRKIKHIETKWCDSMRTCDVVIHRDLRVNKDRVYKKLRAPDEGTGFCVLIYGID